MLRTSFVGKLILFGVAAAALAVPAHAQRRPTGAAWQVGEMADGVSCFTAMDYEGGVLLMLMASMGGKFGVAIGSRSAPDQEGRHETLRWHLGAAVHALDAAGIRSAGRHGYAAIVDPPFRADFARASKARILRRDHSLFDTISLKGSADGVRRLDACIARLRERSLRGIETRDIARLPLNDPFRRTAPFPSRATTNLSSYFSNEDYPAAAVRAEEEGRSLMRLEIGADGRVAACTIVESSGSNLLDAASCRHVRVRARFAPARDSKGVPVADTVIASILWQLPEEVPVAAPAWVKPR